MSLGGLVRRTPALRAALAAPIAIRRSWIAYKSKSGKHILDQMQAMITSDVRIRVPEFEGEFVIGPRSHLLHRILSTGAYEPKMVSLFLSHLKPDGDVVDVGANVGFFTVLAARHLRGGRVLAAEPTAAAHGRLVQNVEINGVGDKVIIFNGLVSDVEKIEHVNVIVGKEEYSSMGKLVHPTIAGEAFKVEEMPARTLDSLVKEHGLKPALIKVDVEGCEAMVFAGAEETLRTHRPIVLSEFVRPMLESNGSSPEALFAMFDRYGYDLHDPHDPRGIPGADGSIDMIAIPRPH